MTATHWAILATASTLTLTALITHLVHSDNSTWDAIHYRCTTKRWGIAPVGDGAWRHTLGISFGIAGHGFALFRWPRHVLHHPWKPCKCDGCLTGKPPCRCKDCS
ncbi:hypothetical protein [Streptomyces griseosporeus]